MLVLVCIASAVRVPRRSAFPTAPLGGRAGSSRCVPRNATPVGGKLVAIARYLSIWRALAHEIVGL